MLCLQALSRQVSECNSKGFSCHFVPSQMCRLCLQVMKCIVEALADVLSRPHPMPLSQECLVTLKTGEPHPKEDSRLFLTKSNPTVFLTKRLNFKHNFGYNSKCLHVKECLFYFLFVCFFVYFILFKVYSMDQCHTQM